MTVCSNAQRGKETQPFRYVRRQYMTGQRCLTAATSGSLIHTLSLSDLNCWLVVCGCGSHSLLNLAGHGQEGLLDVAGVLG